MDAHRCLTLVFRLGVYKKYETTCTNVLKPLQLQPFTSSPFTQNVDQSPGFGQNRVNFHRTPGRGTAGGVGADPTWPNRARCSIPCDVTLGSGGGGGAAGRHSRLGGTQRRSCFGRAAVWVVRFVVVFSPYLYRCCSCFPSVCCSVKLPLSRPTSFCLFPSILLRTPAGGGAAAWRFCCRRQLNQNMGTTFWE